MTDEEKKLYKAFMDDVRECLEEVEDEPVIMVPGDLSEDETREYLIEQYLVKRPDMSEEEILKEVEKWIEAKRYFESRTDYMRLGDELDEVIMTHASEGREAIEKAVREYVTNEFKRVYPDKHEEEFKPSIETYVTAIMLNDPVATVISGRMARAERQKRYKKLMGE